MLVPIDQRMRGSLVALLSASLLSTSLLGCAGTPRTAVPLELTNQVLVKDVGRVRVWGDAAVPNFEALAAHRLEQVRRHRPEFFANRNPHAAYIALSGGGANGAFGAGFLNGWTASGTRPQFEIVSGVSTGALMAPFVFLGSRYDMQLREIYTNYSTRDLLRRQVLAGLAGGSAFSDTKPLQRLIARYITPRLLAEIAGEHQKGRRLLVGTTNIDADRPVIWDMGRIASEGTVESLALFRSVLLASSALPGLFPPVFIKVTANSQTFKEMHVDGGTTDNAFLLPLHLDFRSLDRRLKRRLRRSLFIIANTKTGPNPEVTKNTAIEIAGRSIATLVKQQLEGDLIKLYLRSKENSIDFNLASIPLSFNDKPKEAFDKGYMRKLFRLGYDLASRKYSWTKRPPGI